MEGVFEFRVKFSKLICTDVFEFGVMFSNSEWSFEIQSDFFEFLVMF